MQFDSAHRGYSVPRSYEWQGAEYVIRDCVVRTGANAGKYAGYGQYKTKRKDGVIVWKPCLEGTSFDEIEPFRHV